MIPCDPKEYQHLLYDKRKFKGRIEDSTDFNKYHFNILPNKSAEEQHPAFPWYYVVLLDTGELVCVHGRRFSPDKDLLYIGMGVIHHNEYW